MPSKTPRDDEHVRHAAPEDELIRLEQAHRDLANRSRGSDLPAPEMRRITVHKPPADPELTTGDLP
ncbi:hypothetical protein [Nonomuraea sp. NPDC049400]|uniref:hypothetical protein n=1 Tax=Nonomuraea sp. NPDC049400 TaxID=3364352 RepID=UPI003790EF7B